MKKDSSENINKMLWKWSRSNGARGFRNVFFCSHSISIINAQWTYTHFCIRHKLYDIIILYYGAYINDFPG